MTMFTTSEINVEDIEKRFDL